MMQSVTPPYLDRQRAKLKRSRLFVDATYNGAPIRAQRQAQDVEVDTGQGFRITQEITAFVDWVDLAAEPHHGDELTFQSMGLTYRVDSFKLQGDGFCRIVLKNA